MHLARIPDRDSLAFRISSWIAGGGYDLPTGKVIVSRRQKWCRRLGIAVITYLLLPLAIFEVKESGPRPRLGMPWASPGWDISDNLEYSEGAWPFVVWKPVLTTYCRARGFDLPASWR
jgi:hypothetical protein